MYYDRIDISEGIDPTKIIKVENLWFVTIGFFYHGFKFQDYVCDDIMDVIIWQY